MNASPLTGASPEPEFGADVHDVARLLRVAFERRTRTMGLTRSQWWVVSSLLRIDGATQTEIAAYLQMERAPLGKILDKLEANGWIVRRADPSDRRVRRVHRTRKIEPFIPALVLTSCATFEAATQGVGDERRLALLDGLKLMKRNLALALDDPYERPEAEVVASRRAGATQKAEPAKASVPRRKKST